MRPTGPLHLGNYFGALKNWITLQETYDCYFFVADWHSLTTEYADPAIIREWSHEIVLDWLGAGLDPDQATLFVQSQVPQHAELHLLLSMLTPLGWLERVPSYKEVRDELAGTRDLNMYGFLGYPLLQSADVMLYRGEVVPVGGDQLAHLELTREIARRFNHLYQREVLIEPQPLLTNTPKVPGLDGRKMSKSYNNGIYLNDTADVVAKKIMPAVTDPARVRRTDPGNPDVCLMYDYHKIFSGEAQQADVCVQCRSAAIGCVDDKKNLLVNMEKVLAPIRERRAAWAARPRDVADILARGTAKARAEAETMMETVRDCMGMRP